MGKLSSAFEKADTSAAYSYGAMNFIPALAVRFQISNSGTRWRGIFKGLPQDGGRPDFSKSFVPLSSIKACRMNLISAGSISLDSTFKGSLIIDIPLYFYESFSPGGSLNIPQGPFYRKFE
jgi:hypothetical protein